MTARVTVPAGADMPRVAALAGNPDPASRWYENGELWVKGVTQDALAAALASVGDGPPVVVPHSVTPLQARRALRAAGLLGLVDAAIAAASGDAQDAWRYAQVVERADPTLNAIASQLGVTPAQMDALFQAAAIL